MGFVARLAVRDFRNYECGEVTPSSGLNLVVGRNGQGKTSLLEAVALVSTGRLLRGSRDTQAIRLGQPSGEVKAELGDQGTEVAVLIAHGQRKRVLLNGLALARASDILGRLPSVSFSTVDLRVVTGDPSDRRAFLDAELAQLWPAYLRHLSVYKRALEQRNALLKAAQIGYVPDEAFEAWEEALGQHGAGMRLSRREWVAAAAGPAQEAYQFLGGGETMGLDYVLADDGVEPERLAQGLRDARSVDVRRGATSVGPHRDDLAVTVDGRDARAYGSQGQQRTAVLALMAATMASVRETLGQPPVLLLDDVFSDLDGERRSRLTELALAAEGQVFLTATESSLAGPSVLSRAAVFRVQSGTVRAE